MGDYIYYTQANGERCSLTHMAFIYQEKMNVESHLLIISNIGLTGFPG